MRCTVNIKPDQLIAKTLALAGVFLWEEPGTAATKILSNAQTDPYL